MTRLVELVEYGTAVIDEPDDALDELSVVAGDRLQLEHAGKGLVLLRATSHVGLIVTPRVTVRIRPKVPLDSVFVMLGIEGRKDRDLWKLDQPAGAYGSHADDLVPAVVALFLREVDRLTARGLNHGYVNQYEPLLAIRGRVDLTETMRRPWSRSPVPCSFDEFIPDIWINQVLRAALATAREVPGLSAPLRSQVHLQAQRFEGIRSIAVDIDRVDRWTPNRNERRYETAMRLAALILRSLSLADRSGQHRAASFTVDMNALFEQFIGRELADRLPPGLELEEQYSTTLDVWGRMPIRPDLVIHRRDARGDVRYVGDVKYKLTERNGTTADHYQLLAYATVFGLREGVLIYCQRPEDGDGLAAVGALPVASVRIRGSEVTNHVYRFDVAGNRQAIAARLDELASWIVSRAMALPETDERHSSLGFEARSA